MYRITVVIRKDIRVECIEDVGGEGFSRLYLCVSARLKIREVGLPIEAAPKLIEIGAE